MTTGDTQRPQIAFATGVNTGEPEYRLSAAELATLDRDVLEHRLLQTHGRIDWQLEFLRGELGYYKMHMVKLIGRIDTRQLSGLVEDAIAGLERLQAELEGRSQEEPT